MHRDFETNLTAEEAVIAAKISRRGFMGRGATAAATLASLIGSEPRLVRAATPPATADSLIVLWMAGGMASTETFDPKRYTPFAPGVHTSEVLSTFPAIDTVVDHIKFSQGLESIAKVIDRGSLIRTFQAADLGFILHSRHQFHWHTGYVPPQPMAVPHIGAVIAKTLGPRVRHHAAIHLDRPEPGDRREIGGVEIVPYRRFSRQRIRSRSCIADPAGRSLGSPSARRPGQRPLHKPPQALRKGARQSARLSVRRRLPAAKSAALARRRGPSPDLAFGQSLRPLARTKEQIRSL